MSKGIGPVSPPRARCRGTLLLCVAFPGVRASSTFDSRTRHPRLTSHCRCRGSVLRAHLESLITLELVRMLPAGEGWARISERECLTLGTMPRQRQGEVRCARHGRRTGGEPRKRVSPLGTLTEGTPHRSDKGMERERVEAS